MKRAELIAGLKQSGYTFDGGIDPHAKAVFITKRGMHFTGQWSLPAESKEDTFEFRIGPGPVDDVVVVYEAGGKRAILPLSEVSAVVLTD